MCKGHAVADVVPAPSMSFPAALRPEALPRQDAGCVPEFGRFAVATMCCCSPRQDAALVTKSSASERRFLEGGLKLLWARSLVAPRGCYSCTRRPWAEAPPPPLGCVVRLHAAAAAT